jgi:hypothetical protein
LFADSSPGADDDSDLGRRLVLPHDDEDECEAPLLLLVPSATCEKDPPEDERRGLPMAEVYFL